MNNRQLMRIKASAFFLEMIPAGISRIAVRGFNLSNRSSIYRLNAMAALRANTIQSTTNKSKIQRLKFQIPEK